MGEILNIDEGDLLNVLISPEDLETLLTNKKLGLGIEKNYLFIEVVKG